ncbi:alpha-glucosidase/alpha-galactosidase [Bauldia sp.]|uniref:alpha-glucosidase/alpha-galactosidase n=1 Tax=Bauldia sp. TaxID=2575872 RepID=UPI003BA9E010
MARGPKIAFIGAGSTVFMKNIVSDVLQRPELADAHVALMDINPERLEDSEVVARKIVLTLGVGASVSTHLNQREALDGADFVVTAFQVGGYDPCTITDFEVPKKYGLRQTIADTLGIGGIMRGIRTVPHLWNVCADMMEVCPDAILLQYVNPMVINTWAIAAKYPKIRQVGLCHSVQGTAKELARDLDIPIEKIRYHCAGINHMAFYLRFEEINEDGTYRDLYPDLRRGYLEGRFPKPPRSNPRCPNKVRYEMLMRLGYFVTESSEHFAEYVPWFIKRDRPDLIEKFDIPLDEYPKRCTENIDRWAAQAKQYREANTIEVKASHEYASEIVNSAWTGAPSVIYGNVRNNGLITSLPDHCAVEVPCLVDRNGIQPTRIGALPPQITALIRTNLNVQELTVAALMEEKREHIYHAAMMDPHTAAELDLDQIWSLVDELLAAHGDWLPEWARLPETRKVA